jgi:hypothetical protein
MARDDDHTWAELVESFHASPDDDVRRWPAAEDLPPDPERADDGTGDHREGEHGDSFHDASVTLGPLPPLRGRPPVLENESGEDDPSDHFVPAPPPPIPRGDTVSRFAWSGVIAFPAVLLLAAVMQWSPPDPVLVVLVMGFVGGFATLIARMHPSHPHDPGDGAVL